MGSGLGGCRPLLCLQLRFLRILIIPLPLLLELLLIHLLCIPPGVDLGCQPFVCKSQAQVLR